MLKKLKEIKKGFAFVHKLNAQMIGVSFLDALLASALPFINLVMSAKILESLLSRVALKEMAQLIFITVFLNFSLMALSKSTSLWRSRCIRHMCYNSDMYLNSKVMQMDYSAIEDPKTHLLRKKIEEYENMNTGGAYQFMDAFYRGLKSLLSVSFALIIMPNLLFTSSGDFWASSGLLLLMGLNLVISIVIQAKNASKMYGFFGEVMNINRIYGYYQDHVSNYNSGKSIRIYGQEPLLLGCVKNFVNISMKGIFDKLGQTSALMTGTSSLFSTLSSGLVFVLVAIKAATGAIAASSVLKYIGGIMQLISGLEGMVRALFEMVNNLQYLNDYYAFLEIENHMYRGSLPVEKRDDDAYEIEFKNVSFKYPGTEVYALKNVSLKLQIGERMAIVGMNGSGKTTLIKLLCRLYDPTEGIITLNGIDIKKYNYEDYLSLFSVVFQDFKLFSFSLGQNVATTARYDSQEVYSALHQVGLSSRVAQMKNGLETYLYKYFDVSGEEISGGEGQKVALARAVHRNAPMVILDEPTSALDPVAEYDIYMHFNDIVQTKTAFYISHRLSSCRFCDSIAVFHEGALIERGSHDVLVAQPQSKYHELWHAQAQYYNEPA